MEHVDAAEFAEWMLFYQSEPFGDLRDDARAASIPMWVSTMFGNTRPKLSDFMLKFGQKQEAQTPEEMWGILAAAATVHNERVAAGG